MNITGYNQHVPLQPSFGMSASGFSTLATMQQCGSGGSSGRRKRSWSRAVFSNLQRKGLEKRFQIQKYITKPDRRQLAATLGLTDAQVCVIYLFTFVYKKLCSIHQTISFKDLNLNDRFQNTLAKEYYCHLHTRLHLSTHLHFIHMYILFFAKWYILYALRKSAFWWRPAVLSW